MRGTVRNDHSHQWRPFRSVRRLCRRLRETVCGSCPAEQLRHGSPGL